jgi:hypothetical protein
VSSRRIPIVCIVLLLSAAAVRLSLHPQVSARVVSVPIPVIDQLLMRLKCKSSLGVSAAADNEMNIKTAFAPCEH